MRCLHGQRRQEGQRLEAVEKVGMRLLADVQTVAEEGKVQLGLLRPPRQVAVVIEVDGSI